MDKRIEDYLHLYLGCDWQWEQHSGTYETGIYGTSLFNSFLLREVALKNGIAKPIYSPEAFGDYRFSKWVAVRDEANFCYNVTNEKSDMSFHVDIEEMHIKVYEDGNDAYPGLENHTYFTEYLRMEFDVFSLIPAGLAIDKTKMNTNG